jgi:hypothetical protein
VLTPIGTKPQMLLAGTSHSWLFPSRAPNHCPYSCAALQLETLVLVRSSSRRVKTGSCPSCSYPPGQGSRTTTRPSRLRLRPFQGEPTSKARVSTLFVSRCLEDACGRDPRPDHHEDRRRHYSEQGEPFRAPRGRQPGRRHRLAGRKMWCTGSTTRLPLAQGGFEVAVGFEPTNNGFAIPLRAERKRSPRESHLAPEASPRPLGPAI